MIFGRRTPHGAGSFFLRIVLPSLAAAGLFTAALFFSFIPSFERNMLDRKRETIRELNASVYSVLERFRAQEKAGGLSGREARARAAELVRDLRYGAENKDYFWITDLEPRMVVHPYRRDLEGKDLSDFTDPAGKRMFKEFVETVKKGGSGYVDYMWQWKDDPSRIVPKLSHVVLFEPWGWVIGTGIYLDDVHREIARLESGLIKLSLGITGLIVLILLYVNQQSLRIERSRAQAEKLLGASEEKYRKLMEASTEGVMLLLGGRPAFANRTLLEMLGYTEEEFSSLSLERVVHQSSSASVDHMLELLEGGGAAPQLEAVISRKSGEKLSALLTASRMSLGGEKGIAVTVKDIDLHKRTEEELSASREKFRALTGVLDIGVFRMDARTFRFHEANRAAASIFGFASAEALCAAGREPVPALSEAAGEAASGPGVRERIVQLSAPDGSERFASVSLTPSAGESGEALWLDGLVEDVTGRMKAEAEREKMLAELQMSLGSLNQPVKAVAAGRLSCPAATTIARAAALMTRAGCSSILVESGGETVGIVTDHDMRTRVLAGSQRPEDPITRIMSSPIISVGEDSLLFEAVLVMHDRRIRHLAVRDASGKVSGVVDEKELLGLKWYSPAVLMEELGRAASPEDVSKVCGRLPRVVKTLSDSGADAAGINRVITAAADAAVDRLAALTAAEMGEPPVPFVFLALGSQARGEQTLATDQDNALVYADPEPGREAAAENYFREFSGRVCARLADAGYPLCKGGAMASNPKWCRPLSAWKDYFSRWAQVTDAQDLLDVNIFFDFRAVYGESSLASELRGHVMSAVKGRSIFFLNLANNALLYKFPVGMMGNLVPEDSGERKGLVSLKQVARMISDFARVYALRAGVDRLSTVERLKALYLANVLDKAEYEGISQAFVSLMRIRLKHQAFRLGAGAAPDNWLAPGSLSQSDQLLLKGSAAGALAASNRLKYLVKFLIV